MAEKTAKYQLVVAIILAVVTIGNLVFMYASRPTAELKQTVTEHSARIGTLEVGRMENATNIKSLENQMATNRDENWREHQAILAKLDEINRRLK